jgi:hypothetical protein
VAIYLFSYDNESSIKSKTNKTQKVVDQYFFRCGFSNAKCAAAPNTEWTL